MALEPLPENIDQAIRDLASGKRDTQGAIYELLLAASDRKVAWADRAWRELTPLLRHRDNRVRSIAGQVLCNIARSASSVLVEQDLDALVSITHDERFVTARHVLLRLWKTGLEDPALRAKLVGRLAERFASSEGEKNGTLVRHDIVRTLRSLFDVTDDAAVKATAMALISSERDDKYRRKYAGVWRDAFPAEPRSSRL